ncbi:MAG: ABC transporter permease [Vicinamibacterales bacterium]
MHHLFAYLRSFVKGLRRPSQLDADMNDEMRFHIEMEARRLQQQGLDRMEAHRRAAVAFGGVEKYRGAGRDVLGLTWARGMSTDFKLGTRMLRKYPGLTTVALFALSLAIGAGSAYFEFINDLMHGELPFPDAARIVGIQLWDQERSTPEHRQTAEFVEWRGTLRSFEDLAAYRTLERNLITDDGRVEPTRGVEISASAFRIARVPPLLGRPLVPEDERAGAAPVVVIGHGLWTTRFASDSNVIGQTVRLGTTPYTIVGVMPEGFGLPISHSLWVPLQLNDAAYPRYQGPRTNMLGKLAEGMTVSAAQAELDARHARGAAETAGIERRVQPVVKSYVESVWSAIEDSRVQSIAMYAANLFFVGLLALCGANVATLVFARTATREAEISVRSALGASRARIAGQLFAEALVLSSIATLIGLTVASYGLSWVKAVVSAGQGRPLMFWWNDQLRPDTLAYAALLAVVSALIVGVVPALKATGPRVQERLKHASGGSASGLKFGGVWTGVIMTQVAVTVMFLAMVGLLGWTAYVSNGGERRRNFPASEYVAVRLTLDRAPANSAAEAEAAEAASRRQLRATYGELSRRLSVDPAVVAATYGMSLPGMNLQDFRLEVDGAGSAGPAATFVRTTQVSVNYFDTFNAPVVAGRRFTEADLQPGRDVAIVDRTFVREVLNGQDAIGRHVRDGGDERDQPGPWLEIVGVIPDLTDDANKTAGDAMLFRPAPAESLSTIYLALHVRGNPAALMSRIPLIASDVDPALRLGGLTTLDKLGEADKIALDFFARLLAGVSLVAIILATAGVYALMSFTVSRRTSEIGIGSPSGPTRAAS